MLHIKSRNFSAAPLIIRMGKMPKDDFLNHLATLKVLTSAAEYEIWVKRGDSYRV